MINLRCSSCKHKRFGPKCDAFPERIPDAILEAEHDHSTPFPGDGGIMFEYANEAFRKQAEAHAKYHASSGNTGEE
jgi:hypothetical protein